MRVIYKPKVRYACNALATEFAVGTCAYFNGSSIEDFVISSFFEAIKPASLDTLAQVLSQHSAERERLGKYHHQQLQKAQYEADLARRRYEKVDPDNRLVASTLEQQWEEKLRALQKLKESVERFEKQPTQPKLDSQLRQSIIDINQQLPNLWSTNQLTNEHRKKLLRSLISQIIVQRLQPDQIQVKIVWVSGHFSTGIVRPSVHRQADVTGYEDMVQRTKEEWQAGKTDKEIAKILTREGFRSARNLDISSGIVFKIRRRHQLQSAIQEYRMAEKVDGMWTVRGLCCHLGLSQSWLYRYLKSGKVPDSHIIRQPPHNVYLIRDEPELLERLKSEAPSKR